MPQRIVPPAFRFIAPGVETVRVPKSLIKRLADHLLAEYNATAAAAGEDEAEGAATAEGAVAAEGAGAAAAARPQRSGAASMAALPMRESYEKR